MTKVHVLVLTLLFGVAGVHAWGVNQKDADKMIADQMDALRKDPGAWNGELLKLDPHLLLESLKPYQKDPSGVIRRCVYHILCAVGERSSEAVVRQEVVVRLLLSFRDTEAGGPMDWYLEPYNKVDFNDEAKTMILDFVQKGAALRLAGVAEIREAEPMLRKFAETNWKKAELPCQTGGFEAALALARMGDKKCIGDCIEAIEQQTKSPLFVYWTSTLEAAANMRQPEGVTFLVEWLDNDERLKGADIIHTKKACYALAHLCWIIADFPLKARVFPSLRPYGYPSYTDADVETARKWMKEHKDYKIIK